ncbi:hypothetical protein IT575_01460 [bacterium]|nr:hypothetical protein [bacterium]
MSDNLEKPFDPEAQPAGQPPQSGDAWTAEEAAVPALPAEDLVNIPQEAQLPVEPLSAAGPDAAAHELPATSAFEPEGPGDEAAEPEDSESWNEPPVESWSEAADAAEDEAVDEEADLSAQQHAEQTSGQPVDIAPQASIEELLMSIDAARRHIMGLSFPPTTLVLPPARAVGHRLASSVLAKSNLPLRPFSTVDGLAVNSADLLLGKERRERDERRRGKGRRAGREGEQAEGMSMPEAQSDELLAEGETLAAGDESWDSAEGWSDEQSGAAEADAADNGADAPGQGGPQMARLNLRPAPQTSRKDDSVGSGEAVPIAVGEEVPRGCDFVIPFSVLEGEPASLEPPVLDPAPPKWQEKDGSVTVNKGRMRDDRERQAAMRRGADKNAAQESDGDVDDDDLPGREPPRDWELAQYYQSGSIELLRVERLGGGTLISIGAWARNREALFHEKTMLRAGEVALLEALGVPEVEVYRRPIVGIASLSEPLPSPNRSPQRRESGPRRGGRASEAMQMAGVPEGRSAPEKPSRRNAPAVVEEHDEFEDLDLPSGICPLTQLCMHLCRSAQVPALPLGYAPKRFRPLSLRMERWLNQVDVLLLVGGSHHGPRCVAQDVLGTYGRLAVTGADIHPGGNISAASLAGKPVFSMPGSLPEVLAGFVLFVRPLLHRHASPLHFESEIPIVLEQGSRIRFPFSTAVGLRYSYNPDKHCFASRYSGPARSGGNRDSDTWMEFVRGQALAVFEGGREYQDGDVVTAYPY